MPVALIPAVVSAGIGLYQVLFSGKAKAKRELKKAAANSPQYAGDQGVDRYYQEAYNRYMTSPENTTAYQSMMKNIGTSRANTLNWLQDRRMALAGAGQIEASGLAAQQNALVNAEQMRNQRFSALGQATQAKGAADMQKFNINKLMPYQNKLNLLSAELGAATQKQAQGMANIYSGASSIGQYYAGTTAAERKEDQWWKN